MRQTIPTVSARMMLAMNTKVGAERFEVSLSLLHTVVIGVSGRARTYDQSVNSRPLYH